MKSELFICACQWQYLVLPGVSDTGWRVCDHNTAFCSCKFPREFWLAGCCLLVWTLRSTQQFLSLQMHFWAWTLALWQSVLRWDPEERLSLGNTSVLLCFWRIRETIKGWSANQWNLSPLFSLHCRVEGDFGMVRHGACRRYCFEHNS